MGIQKNLLLHPKAHLPQLLQLSPQNADVFKLDWPENKQPLAARTSNVTCLIICVHVYVQLNDLKYSYIHAHDVQ